MFEYFLSFKISKQINTQQNYAEGRHWHQIEQMSSKGGNWSSKTEFRRVAQLLSFLFIFLFIFIGGVELYFSFVPSFQTVKDYSMSMGVKSNNNSSTYGTSKTYSGRKTRDCKQMEEH